ncbi:MAG: M48 family metallopeptidase [Candidatus Micrarchaeia archaeon]
MHLDPVIVGEKILPVALVKKNTRVMKGKVVEDTIVIEVPSAWKESYAMECAARIRKRVEKVLIKNPYAFENGKLPNFKGMRRIIAMDEAFSVNREQTKGKRIRVSVGEGAISIKIPEMLREEDEPMVSRAVIRAISKRFFKKFVSEVEEENSKFFNSRFNAIRLKKTTGRWGSYSSKGNMNFSSLLLFMPKEIRESVIVHELAHTRVRDHSPKFWSLVYSIMPDYKERRKWLNRYQSFPLDKRPEEYRPLGT